MATVSFYEIEVGTAYTRHDLAKAWGYASWEALARGVVTPAGTPYIILFVTEEKRKSDTGYRDRLEGSTLLWEGPADHYGEDRMVRAQQTGEEIHVFYRREHAEPFTYLGIADGTLTQAFADRPSVFSLRLR